MIILLTSAYNLLESLTGSYSLIWSGLGVEIIYTLLVIPYVSKVVSRHIHVLSLMMSKLNNYTNLFFPVYKFNAHAAILNRGRKSTGTEYGDRLLPLDIYHHN